MSADSTELTFIRCSSCRSLVPAMSTRCRMCGADLQAKKPTATPEATAPKEKIEAKAPAIVASTELDPLNEFLSEEDQFDDVDIVDDQLEASDKESDEEFSAGNPSEFRDDFEDDFDEEQAIKELDSLLEELNATSVATAVPIPVVATPVVPVVTKATKSELIDVLEPKVVPKKTETKIEPVKVMTPVAASVIPQNFSSPEPKIPTKAEIKEDIIKEENIMEKELRAVESKVTSIKSAGIKQQPDKQTALFGWFVSYQEAVGVSREIREGKFFVTAKSLKPNDLIIEDDSVSTPHAMITVSHELGFQIQDLMSEHGLYIKKHGSKKYEVIDDIEVVENGDWIRFGNIEFMVVIMPV